MKEFQKELQKELQGVSNILNQIQSTTYRVLEIGSHLGGLGIAAGDDLLRFSRTTMTSINRGNTSISKATSLLAKLVDEGREHDSPVAEL